MASRLGRISRKPDGEPGARGGSIWSEPIWRFVIGVMLVGAFSPVLLELFAHMGSHPWARSSAVFAWLGWVAARANPEGPRAPSSTVVWASLAFALALAFVAVSGDAPRIGRLGLAIGLVGLVWGAGWSKVAPALVLIWVVPLPTMLLEILSPHLEGLLASLCAGLVPGLELELSGPSPVLSMLSGESLRFDPASGGLATLFSLAGLGWFREASRGGSVSAAAARAARWSALWVPVQLALVLAAGGALALGMGSDAAQTLLDHGGWISISILGVVLSMSALCDGATESGERAPC